MDNFVATIKARLEKEIVKKKEYKREVERLKEYIQHLTKPLDQTTSAAPPLMNTSQEIFEEEKNIAKETKEWLISNRQEVVVFAKRLALAYRQTSSLLLRIATLAEAWDNAQDVRDRIIPCLKVLKGVSKQELVNRKVIAPGAAYDFSSWYMTLIIRSEIIEKIKTDTIRIEERTKEVRKKILAMAANALEKDIVRANNLQFENLKHKIQEIFFTIGPVLKQNLTKAVDFLFIFRNFQRQESEWEDTFVEC